MKIYKVLSKDSSHIFVLGLDNVNELKFERVQDVTDVFNKYCPYHTIYVRFEKKVNGKKIGITYNFAKGTNGTKTIKRIYLNNIPVKKIEYNNMDIHNLLAEFTHLNGYKCTTSVINEWFEWEL